MTDMSKQTEALKLALEALEWINRVNAMDSEYKQKARESLNAIYEALAEQPAHQHIEHCLWARNGNQPCPHVQPAQRTWVNATTWRGLTVDEILYCVELENPKAIVEEVEAKLKAKNSL